MASVEMDENQERDAFFSILGGPTCMQELKTYFALSKSEAEIEAICLQAPETLAQEWRDKRVNAQEPASVLGFYAQTKNYCYELVGIEKHFTGDHCSKFRRIADFLLEQGCLKGCDFGSGVGTWGLYLNQRGISCDFADVSATNLQFIQQRLQARSIEKSKTYLLDSQKLLSESYDFITAFDVLEHATDLQGTLRQMRQALKPGGFLIYDFVYHHEEENPLHLFDDLHAIRKCIRAEGFARSGSIREFKIYYKAERPELINQLLGWTDRTLWSTREAFRSLAGKVSRR